MLICINLKNKIILFCKLLFSFNVVLWTCSCVFTSFYIIIWLPIIHEWTHSGLFNQLFTMCPFGWFQYFHFAFIIIAVVNMLGVSFSCPNLAHFKTAWIDTIQWFSWKCVHISDQLCTDATYCNLKYICQFDRWNMSILLILLSWMTEVKHSPCG